MRLFFFRATAILGALTLAACGDSAPSPAGFHTLTIENYLSWCSVAFESDAPSTSATVTKSVPTGIPLHLAGEKANDTFVWGYWRGTAGDTTMTHDVQMNTTVSVDADTTIQACCPFATAPTTPCPDPS